MQRIIISIIGLTMSVVTLSCNGKAQNESGDDKNKVEQTKEENKPSATIPAGMENILGEWTLVKILRDENGNHKIDGNEENAIIESAGTIKLNADGTCKYETIMDGRYEITTEADGRKRLIYYDMSGTEFPRRLYINSVSKDELVININEGGGSQFELYKRP